jgi:hypothetical protein
MAPCSQNLDFAGAGGLHRGSSCENRKGRPYLPHDYLPNLYIAASS